MAKSQTKITIPIKLRTNLIHFEKTLERSAYGGGENSFKFATFEVLEKTRDHMLGVFDKTQKTQGSGKLRETLSRIYINANKYKIIGHIAKTDELPSYWKFQELGIKGYTRKQAYIFSRTAGRLVPIKHSLLPPSANFSYKSQMLKGFGRVTYIQINNPGIKGRGFISAGKQYLQVNGAQLFSNSFSAILNRLVSEHKSRYKM